MNLFFVTRDQNRLSARIFTCEEELDFAGHPLLGLAAYLHRNADSDETELQWQLALNQRKVSLTTRSVGAHVSATLDQGVAQFNEPLNSQQALQFAKAMNLTAEQLADLPVQVVSTGLPYVILPVQAGLENAKVVIDDLEARLAEVGAKFLYVIDVETFEGRTWDNDGSVEDIATGSAAGPVAAYLYRCGKIADPENITLYQGSFLHRPSQMQLRLSVTDPEQIQVWLSGLVCHVADIQLAEEIFPAET